MATLHLMHDVTANAALLTLLTGPRWAIGPRDLGLLERPGRASWPAVAAAATAPASIDAHLVADRRRHRPGRDPVPRRRAARPRRRARTPPEALERFALLAAELRLLRSPRRRAAARHRAPDHRHHRRRRRARLGGEPGGRGPARQPRPVRPGGRRLPGRRRRRDAAGAAGLPDRRGRPGQRPRRRDPDRGRLGQAADRAPRQGPGVGRGLPGRRLRRPGSRRTGPGRCGRPRPRCCRRRCAATPATCRSCAATTRPRSTPTAPTRRAHDAHRGAAARLRRVHPRRAPAVGDVVLLEPAAARRSGPSAYQQVVRDQLRRVGRAGRRLARQAGRRATRTRTPPRTRRGPGRPTGVGAEAQRRLEAAALVARRRPDAPTTTGLDVVEAARVADWDAEVERLLAEARGRAQRRDRGAAARQPVGDRACCGCARTRTRSPASWPGRCRGRPSGRPGSARCSTPGSRPASASSRCSTPTTCPGRADLGIDDEADLDELIEPFEDGPVRRPGAARRRGVVRAGARRPGGARPDRRGLRRGRRRVPGRGLEDQPGARPPTRSSSRSTGSRGPSCAACRSSRCARRSTTCAPARSSSRHDDLPGPRASSRRLVSPCS